MTLRQKLETFVAICRHRWANAHRSPRTLSQRRWTYAALLGMFCLSSLQATAAQPAATEQKIKAALQAETRCEFIDMPLPDVLAFFADMHHIPIRLDRPALAAGKLDGPLLVTFSSEKDSLQDALRQVLKPWGLVCVVQRDALVITTPAASRRPPRPEPAKPSRPAETPPQPAAKPPKSLSRTWKDSTGRYTVNAELVEVTDDQARLKKLDGRIIEIPLVRLSEADREYLQTLFESSRQQLSEAEAVEKITKLGGRFRFAENGPARVAISLDLAESADPDAALEFVSRLRRLQSLRLEGTKVTDAGLGHIKDLPELYHLGLSQTQITDAGLKHVGGLTNLRSLEISRCPQITDGGLQELRGLSRLESLYLRVTSITDAGLVHLQKLPRLMKLFAEQTKVTDAGLDELRKVLPLLSAYRS